ncbi:MAG: carboxypeptidase-like regulatory domain-containing protein, partial [Ilumatobacteraceae bacterium]
RTVDLAAAQQVSGLSVTLAPTTGAITGTVSVGDRGPTGGVTVAVTGADVDQSTITASVGEVGTYVFDSLPVPATYTITFSKPGLLSQTRLVDLDPLAGRGSAFGIDARMVPSTAIVRGIVRTTSGVPVPGASVQLNDGSESRDLLSADDPLGRFEFSGVDPGAYTLTASRPGTSPSVLLVNVIAADVVDLTVNLEPQASLFGRVLVLDPTTGQFVPFAPCAVPPVAGPPCGAVVRLFDAGDFPGLPSQAIATAATDAEGAYTFASLPAPDDFVVSVYVGEATDPLDSVLEQTQPSQAVEVPTFQIRQAS